MVELSADFRERIEQIENFSIWESPKSACGLILEGKAAVKQHIAQTFREDPTWKLAIEDIIAEGDRVAIRATWQSQGKPTQNVMVFYRLMEGKIIDDFYCDTPLE